MNYHCHTLESYQRLQNRILPANKDTPIHGSELFKSSEIKKVNNQVLEGFLSDIFILRNRSIIAFSFNTPQTFYITDLIGR